MTALPFVDTSALAKYYVAEPGSAAVQAWLQDTGAVAISRLAMVEFRGLLARRRRERTLAARIEAAIQAQFLAHVGLGLWRVRPLDDADLDAATRVIDRLPRLALRTFDALHLGAALNAEAPALATADRLMAEAARALGVKPVFFG
jgi:uncharacterized protein